MGRTLPKDHEDHIDEKGFNSLSHENLVHTFIPMLPAMKIPDAKAAVDREWEKLEKLPSWQMTNVKSKTEVILETRKKAKNSPFRCADGHLSSQQCEVGAEVSKNTGAAVSKTFRVFTLHSQNRVRLHLK